VASRVARDEEKLTLQTAEEAELARSHVGGANWSVASVKERQQHRNPAPPSSTSALLQEASCKLNFGAKRTHGHGSAALRGVADGETVGLITYMRTDSVT
jgi:DNA topoisomerase-1